MAKKIKEITTQNEAGLKSIYRIWLLKFFLVIPWKYKAPRTTSESIPDNVDIEQVILNWGEIRDKFQLLLFAQEDSFLKREIFRHPRIGYIDFFQTLEFIEAHHKHHFRQINNLLSNI